MSEPAAPLRVWRLVKERHADTAFDGEGARLYGGRWNSNGHRVVYTSSSLALASLETLVNLDTSLPLPRFIAYCVYLPADYVAQVSLPSSAVAAPLPSLMETRRLGDTWITEGIHPALSVPSALVPQEFNFLLNPVHPFFPKLVIAPPIPFALDTRFQR
jgi:RES domain-containing protein